MFVRMRYRIPGLLLLLILLAVTVRAQNETDKSHAITWTEIAPGMQHAVIHNRGISEFRLQAFRIDLARFDIRAADARSYTGMDGVASAAQMAAQEHAILAINASFFDENKRPLGMVITEGRRINPFRQADWGVLVLSGGVMKLIHTRDWQKKPDRKADFALQVGPRIVVDGVPTRLKPQSARRAAIGILPGGRRLIVIVTDHGSAEAVELALLMARAPELGGFGCREAVLMDGGPSAQLFVDTGQFEINVRGGWPVPIGVVFVARTDESAQAPKEKNDPPPVPTKR